jgi:uncharacterized protein YjcR
MTTNRSSLPRKTLAENMYVDGLTVTEISAEMGVPTTTLRRWRDQFKWDDLCLPQMTPIQVLSMRICRLAEKEKKTAIEVGELKVLCASLVALQKSDAEIEKLQAEAFALKTHGYVEKIGKPQKKFESRYKAKVKNDISGITNEMLDAIIDRLFFGYQIVWYDNKGQRHRFILKSRQIGATFYFAFEAFDDAIRTGDNQLFLSASRSQAEVFKSYIIAFASTEFDIELKGADFLKLSNGAELRFLSTNSNTAQSYHGHLYRDELFWILNFKQVDKVSKPMACHKKWRTTDFSTPSAQSHGAYRIWSGEKYNANLPEKQRQTFDVSHEALKDGKLFEDGIWRHSVTVYDADKIIKAEIAEGKKPADSDLFDVELLKLEYDDSEFKNLFLCEFIDDSQSVFSLATLAKCAVDAEEWSDYKKYEARPFGNKAVGLGFDPSRVNDNATISMLEIPTSPTAPFRLLQRVTYNGMNFEYQANQIKTFVNSHNVIHIGIDITGMGIGVFELVECFYPMATPIHYSVENKNRLVLKALDVINNGRFKFLTQDTEVIRSFMMITRTTSTNGVVIYSSPRNKESGHADAAWSIMHAMAYESIRPQQQTTVTFGH